MCAKEKSDRGSCSLKPPPRKNAPPDQSKSRGRISNSAAERATHREHTRNDENGKPSLCVKTVAPGEVGERFYEKAADIAKSRSTSVAVLRRAGLKIGSDGSVREADFLEFLEQEGERQTADAAHAGDWPA